MFEALGKIYDVQLPTGQGHPNPPVVLILLHGARLEGRRPRGGLSLLRSLATLKVDDWSCCVLHSCRGSTRALATLKDDEVQWFEQRIPMTRLSFPFWWVDPNAGLRIWLKCSRVTGTLWGKVVVEQPREFACIA